MTRMAALIAGLLLAGCSTSSSGDVPDGETSPPETDAGAASDASVTDAGPGGATVAGSVNGARFDKAVSTYAIHGADDPQNLVVYVFSANVPCSAIQSAGWDVKLPGVQFLEIKMKTASVGAFKVVAGPSLGAGEATSNHSIVSAGNANEQVASGGSATLATYVADVRATGAFDVAFKTESLKGTYDAPFCARGTEP